MSEPMYKEWQTGDIIEATDLNAITPLIDALAYNETTEKIETSLTAHELIEKLFEHKTGYLIMYNSSYMSYNCSQIVSIVYDERAVTYTMKTYGTLMGGDIVTSEFTASAYGDTAHFQYVDPGNGAF